MVHVEQEMQCAGGEHWNGLAADLSPFGVPGDRLWGRELAAEVDA